MQTALVTGCNGFCGSHLAAHLRNLGIRVVGLDQQAVPTVPVDDYVRGDLAEKASIDPVLGRHRPELIFHLAGMGRGTDYEIYRANLLATVQLLEAVRAAGLDARILLVGSAAEYGHVEPGRCPLTEESNCRPLGAYGLSKHAVTLLGLDFARRYAMKIVIARPFNIVGAGVPASLVIGGVLQRLRESLQGNSEPVIAIGNLDPERDFVSVEDVVRAYVSMVHADAWGEVFNICSGVPVSVRAIVEMLASFSPRPVRFQVDPALCRANEVQTFFGSFQKARQAFGFEPAQPLALALRAAWDHALGKTA